LEISPSSASSAQERDRVDGDQVEALQKRLEAEGAQGLIIAPSMAPVATVQGGTLTPDAMLNGLPSVTLDAVAVAPGDDSVKALAGSGLGLYYVQEAYKHLKPIAALGDAANVLQAAGIEVPEDGVFSAQTVDDLYADFQEAIRGHRVWSRDAKANDMPA